MIQDHTYAYVYKQIYYIYMKFLCVCLVRCCGTHYHWLSVIYHWHWLSSAHDRRLFCFPEPTGHHHSASVTVLAVKFVCVNTNKVQQ